METNENYIKTGLWLEFAQLELQHRGTEGARLIFKHALSIYELNDLPTIVSAWIRFERCNGTLEHVKHCQEICDRAMYQMRKKFHGAKHKADVPIKKDGKRKAEDDHNPHQHKKAKETKEDFQQLLISKPLKEENGEIDPLKDNVRAFFSNLDYNITTEDLREGFPEITIVNFNVITTGTGKRRGI
jgi:squamous cell carcinoma antigen recognized by T-cells 3